MEYMIVMSNGELYHSGIKGQKWGVRRYQNPDGTLTEAGKKRYRVNSSTGELERKKMDPETKKKIVKGAAVGVGALAATAVTAYYVSKHPEKIKNVISKAHEIKAAFKLPEKQGPKPTKLIRAVVLRNKGMEVCNKIWSNAVKGADEGLANGPRRLAKAVVEGAIMVGGYKALENAVSKKIADQIMSANDPKQIGKYYKKQGVRNKEDED